MFIDALTPGRLSSDLINAKDCRTVCASFLCEGGLSPEEVVTASTQDIGSRIFQRMPGRIEQTFDTLLTEVDGLPGGAEYLRKADITVEGDEITATESTSLDLSALGGIIRPEIERPGASKEAMTIQQHLDTVRLFVIKALTIEFLIRQCRSFGEADALISRMFDIHGFRKSCLNIGIYVELVNKANGFAQVSEVITRVLSYGMKLTPEFAVACYGSLTDEEKATKVPDLLAFEGMPQAFYSPDMYAIFLEEARDFADVEKVLEDMSARSVTVNKSIWELSIAKCAKGEDYAYLIGVAKLSYGDGNIPLDFWKSLFTKGKKDADVIIFCVFESLNRGFTKTADLLREISISPQVCRDGILGYLNRPPYNKPAFTDKYDMFKKNPADPRLTKDQRELFDVYHYLKTQASIVSPFNEIDDEGCFMKAVEYKFDGYIVPTPEELVGLKVSLRKVYEPLKTFFEGRNIDIDKIYKLSRLGAISGLAELIGDGSSPDEEVIVKEFEPWIKLYSDARVEVVKAKADDAVSYVRLAYEEGITDIERLVSVLGGLNLNKNQFRAFKERTEAYLVGVGVVRGESAIWAKIFEYVDGVRL